MSQKISASDQRPDESGITVIAKYNLLITSVFDVNRSDRNSEDFAPIEEKIKFDVEDVILGKFTHQVEFFFDKDLTVRILSLNSGSIEASIALVLVGMGSVYEFVSKYKDFAESLSLLKTQLWGLVNPIVNRGFRSQGYFVNINMGVEPAVKAKSIHTSAEERASNYPFGSREFLLYLLIVNVVLMLVVAALVYHAVVTVYFRVP